MSPYPAIAPCGWHITGHRSLAGADDQCSNLKDRDSPGPVECLVMVPFHRLDQPRVMNASESTRNAKIVSNGNHANISPRSMECMCPRTRSEFKVITQANNTAI